MHACASSDLSDDLDEIYKACGSCSSHWQELARALGLDDYSIGAIGKMFGGDTKASMRKMLANWLKCDYRVCDSHPLPSWRTLCKAVDSISEDYKDLALKIQQNHKHNIGIKYCWILY